MSNIALATNSNDSVAPAIHYEIIAKSGTKTIVGAQFPLLDAASIVWRHDDDVVT